MTIQYILRRIIPQNECPGTCHLYPSLIPAFDTPYPTNFGRGFDEDCPCFEWEVIQEILLPDEAALVLRDFVGYETGGFEETASTIGSPRVKLRVV